MKTEAKRWMSMLLALALVLGVLQFGVLAGDAEQEDSDERSSYQDDDDAEDSRVPEAADDDGDEFDAGEADREEDGAQGTDDSGDEMDELDDDEAETPDDDENPDDEEIDPDSALPEFMATGGNLMALPAGESLTESTVYYRFTDDWNVSYNATNVESSANGTYQVGADTSETWYVGEQYTLLSVEAALDLIGVADTSFLDDDDYYYGYALHWYQSSPSFQLGGIANLINLPGEEIELTHKQMRLTVTRGRQYLVSFDTDGGGAVDSIRVKSHSRINPDDVATPTRGQDAFEGWYKDDQLTEAWDFDTDNVTGDITLYAKWVDDDGDGIDGDSDDDDDDDDDDDGDGIDGDSDDDDDDRDDTGNNGSSGGDGSSGGSSSGGSSGGGNNGGQSGTGDSGSVRTGTVSLNDTEIPLATTPPSIVEILDDDVPLGTLPKTGSSKRATGLAGVFALLAGALAVGRGGRDEDAED